MFRLLRVSLLRRWMAAVLAVAILLAPSVVGSGHADLLTKEITRHALLQAEINDHGHSHDDGVEDERLPGHIHRHQVGDHGHDFGRLVTPFIFNRHFIMTTFVHDRSLLAELPRDQRIDRPPRSL